MGLGCAPTLSGGPGAYAACLHGVHIWLAPAIQIQFYARIAVCSAIAYNDLMSSGCH